MRKGKIQNFWRNHLSEEDELLKILGKQSNSITEWHTMMGSIFRWITSCIGKS
ncbi:hypothetical protein OROGR_029583 [Orobanche gracilis]